MLIKNEYIVKCNVFSIIFFFNWNIFFLIFVNNILLFVYIDFSDKNYVKKNIVKYFYEFCFKYKELFIKVVNVISKNFCYMVF